MKIPLAWRNLTHSKARMLLAVVGIGFAIMLMFMQLAFFDSVTVGSTLIFDHLDFDIALRSRTYVYLLRTGKFPRRRLLQALSDDGVASARPVYFGRKFWLNPQTNVRRNILVIGINPSDRVFLVPEITARLEELKRPDTALVDRDTRPIYGPRPRGAIVEVGGRNIEILGEYGLGTAFVELGMMVVSDVNFNRIFDRSSSDEANLGLIKLKPGVDPHVALERLRAVLPADVDVLLRDELNSHERTHWVVRTSTGFIFGSGVLVAFIVGLVIVYQTLAAQIMKYLPEYATLKAIGYSNGYLSGLVLKQACLLCLLGFIPGFVAARGLCAIARKATYLPLDITPQRVMFVFGLALVMSMLSGWLSLRKVHSADPADLF